jgi:hypothetical protein
VAGLDAALATDMVTAASDLDAARAEIFAKLEARSKAQQAVGGVHVIGGDDAHDKFQRGALNWLIVRSGLARWWRRPTRSTSRRSIPGEFRGCRCRPRADDARARRSQLPRHRQDGLVSEAFMLRATQSTSDFTTLLENTMNKVLQAQYSITPDTWRKFCNVSSNPDFRAANRYRWGNLSVLDSLSQTGEFLNKGLSDAEKATLTLATKGNIINCRAR